MEPVSIDTQRQLFVDDFWIGVLGSEVERRRDHPGETDSRVN